MCGAFAPLLAIAMAGTVALAASPAMSGEVVELAQLQRPAPLVDAVRDRNSKAVDALLSTGQRVDVNQRSMDGTTALHWAVYHDDFPLMERLIRAGARTNVQNDYGASPMSEAAVVGDVKVLKRLLAAGADVESPNADGQTALMILARTSNVEAAKLLIAHHANVNAREQWHGQTALMWAAAQAQPPMVRLLAHQGAEVNARSLVNDWERQVTSEPRAQERPSGGLTPLLYAARKGCIECVRILLDAGADIDLADPDGVTPLMLATLNLNFDTAALLVKRGADVNRWDLWGRSPIYEAVDMNTIPVGGRSDRPSTDKTTGLQLAASLLAAGADPNLQLKLFPPFRSLRDDRGKDLMLGPGTTPLVRAAKAGDVGCVKLLLAHGANPSLPTASGITPLMAAAGNGSLGRDTRGRYRNEADAIETVNLLLAAGADVNSRDNNGQTALHGAALWGWSKLVAILAAHNADVMVKDARGRTAADVAQVSGEGVGGPSGPHPETAALLRHLMSTAAGSAASTPGQARSADLWREVPAAE